MANHVGKIIVVEHPMFNYRHVLAQVTEQTRSTYMLTYWNTRTRGWDLEGPKRRKIGYCFVLGSVENFNEVAIQKIAEKLASWAASHIGSIKQLERQYFTKLEQLKAKE